MYRYTTPSLTLKLEGSDFDEVLLFRVAIEQKNIELLKVVEVSGRFKVTVRRKHECE